MTSAKKKEKFKTTLYAIVFLAPFMTFYSLFMLYPILRGAYISLFRFSLGMTPEFVGIANYVATLTDRHFWGSLWNTLFFVIISTPTLLLMAMAFALITNSKIPGRGFFRVVFFLPFTLALSVITNIWVLLLQSHTGFLNVFTASIGIGDIPWLSNPNLAWASVLMATLWWTVGFSMVLLLAGLQEIPQQLYEAAEIDGAGRVKSFFYITLPSMKNVLSMVCLLQIIASFRLFGQPFLMLGGGPGTATRTIVQYIYQTGFQNRQMGMAGTQSVLMLVVMITVTVILNRITRERKVDNA